MDETVTASGLRPSIASPPASLLVVRLGAIGDCLRVLPALARLRRGFPQAEIGWVVDSRTAPLLRGHHSIDRLHVVDARALHAGPMAAVGEMRRAGGELRGAGYEVAIDFHTRLKSGYLIRASGAPVRIGFDRGGGQEANYLFTNVHVRLEDRYANRVERFLSLLAPLGLETSWRGCPAGAAPSRVDGASWPTVAPSHTDAASLLGETAARVDGTFPVDATGSWLRREAGLCIDPAALAKASAWYETEARPPLAVFPGTSLRREADRWPGERWSGVLRRLGDEGIASVVLWGPAELGVARGIVEAAGPRCRLAPPTTLAEMLALVGLFRVYAGSNTAALHMAWMQGVASVVLVGGRPWRIDRPLPPVPSVMLTAGGLEPARKRRGEAARRAIEGITEEEVAAAVRRLIG